MYVLVRRAAESGSKKQAGDSLDEQVWDSWMFGQRGSVVTASLLAGFVHDEIISCALAHACTLRRRVSPGEYGGGRIYIWAFICPFPSRGDDVVTGVFFLVSIGILRWLPGSPGEGQLDAKNFRRHTIVALV
jgi:hypothetical protein